MTNKKNTTENTVKTTTIDVEGDKVATVRTYVVSEPFNESFESLLESMVEDIVIKSIMEEGSPNDTLKEIESTVEEISGKLKNRIEAIMLMKFRKIRNDGPIKMFELFKARTKFEEAEDTEKKPDNNPAKEEDKAGETENE